MNTLTIVFGLAFIIVGCTVAATRLVGRLKPRAPQRHVARPRIALSGPAVDEFADKCRHCRALPIKGYTSDHCWHCGRTQQPIVHAVPTPAAAEDPKGAA